MQYAWPVWPCQLELVTLHRTVGTEFGNPDSSLIMPDFDLSGELSLKIELHMLRPITEKVHSGNGPVSLVQTILVTKWGMELEVTMGGWPFGRLGRICSCLFFFFFFFFWEVKIALKCPGNHENFFFFKVFWKHFWLIIKIFQPKSIDFGPNG